MSRTYRRRSGNQRYKEWYVGQWVSGWGQCVEYDRDSREYKKGLAEYHSDRWDWIKEPGPSWFRNLVAERPQRREAKRQLQKFLRDPKFEVCLNAKDSLPYWL